MLPLRCVPSCQGIEAAPGIRPRCSTLGGNGRLLRSQVTLLILVPLLKHLIFVDGLGVFVLFLFLTEPLCGFIEVSIATASHYCFSLVGEGVCEQSPTRFCIPTAGAICD